MITELKNNTFSYAKQEKRQEKIQLTKADRVKYDRLVMLFLLVVTVIMAVIFF